MTFVFFTKAVLAVLIEHGIAPIVTDRPDFTESSVVVPKGSIQIESGLTWTEESRRSTNLSLPEVLIRFGMTERFELRLGLPNQNWINSDGNPQLQGWDDLYVGFKYQLGSTSDGTDFAIIPAAYFPVGQTGIRSEVVSPEIKFCWAREICGGNSLSGMFYFYLIEIDGRQVTPLQHTISLGLPVSENVGMFIEHILDMSNGEQPSQLLHLGFTFQPRPTVQFDFHFGFGLTSNAPDYFFAAGYSIRL